MPAAVVEEKVRTVDADLAALLEDSELPLAEVLKEIPELAVAKAWARGDIEFGRLKHCVTGRPGVMESIPTLYLEAGLAWSGPKTQQHKKFSLMKGEFDALPQCKKYVKYVSYMDGDEEKWKIVEIKEEEARKLLAPMVRLTDKGLGEIDI